MTSISGDASEFFELSARLTRAAGQVGGLASTALRKTAYAIEADAKALAPVDTGALRNSISTDITGDGRFGTVSAEVGPTVEYGPFVEYGTSRMGPQPFMKPAGDRNAPAFVTAMEQIGGELL